jgi:hypothetical protein
LWQTYLAAQTWNKRPSELLGIVDPYAAYCFDEACGLWGSTISNEMSEVEGRNSADVRMKQMDILSGYLGIDAQYADPTIEDEDG